MFSVSFYVIDRRLYVGFWQTCTVLRDRNRIIEYTYPRKQIAYLQTGWRKLEEVPKIVLKSSNFIYLKKKKNVIINNGNLNGTNVFDNYQSRKNVTTIGYDFACNK